MRPHRIEVLRIHNDVRSRLVQVRLSDHLNSVAVIVAFHRRKGTHPYLHHAWNCMKPLLKDPVKRVHLLILITRRLCVDMDDIAVLRFQLHVRMLQPAQALRK